MKTRLMILSAVACVTALSVTAPAATLLYQYNFDNYVSGTTVAPNTGAAGTLAIKNSANGGTAFSTTGGVSGGAYVATTGQTYGTTNPAGNASTLNVGGTALALPDQDPTDAIAVSLRQFTVSFWVKASATGGFNPANFSRLFILGGADNANNTFAMEMREGKVDVLANNQGSATTNAQGATLVADTWNFIAVTYDGTSTSAFNSTLQAGLTTDARNAQLYEGTDTTAVTRYGVAAAKTTDFVSNTGTIDLSANSLLLLNRNELGRGFNGSMDDFRIYDGVLSPAEVEAVRTSALAGVPEPTMLGGLAFAAAGLLSRRRR